MVGQCSGGGGVKVTLALNRSHPLLLLSSEAGFWRDGGGHQLEVCFSSGMCWLLVAVRLRHSWIRRRNERKVTIRKFSLCLQVGLFSSLMLILGTSWLPGGQHRCPSGEGEEGEEVL